MTNKNINLSDSEWKIIKALWDNAPLSCRQIEETLKADTGWTRHDIFSFLKRMEAKGAIRKTDSSPQRFYPLLDYEQTVSTETSSLLGKLWNGNIGLMISTMIKQEQLDDTEINQLLSVIQKAKDERKP